MSDFAVKIVSITKLTHNIKSFKVERPEDFEYEAGQAVELAIDQKKWENEARPFTLVSLPKDNDLEFIIKSYRDANGVTNAMDSLKRDALLLMSEPWDSLAYQGPGLFLAGGTGITPFLAILRKQFVAGRTSASRLIWANSTEHDTFYEPEFRQVLGAGFVPVVGHPKLSAIKKILKPTTDWVYLCGPEKFVQAQAEMVAELGVPEDKIIRVEE
jgi:ferredoxin-NADP reductase